MRLRHAPLTLALALAGAVLIVAAGCSRSGPATALTPDPFSVFTSTGPGDHYSLEAMVNPEPETDGSFMVVVKLLGRDTDLGIESSIDLLTVDAGHLATWLDESTVVWDGMLTINLKTGESQASTIPGGYSWLDSACALETGAIASLVVRAGDLEVWTATANQTQPKLVYSEHLNTSFGEIIGRIGWGEGGHVYFSVPRAYTSTVLSVSDDGASTKILERAANPAPSPDGRYLAYTSIPAGGELSTEVLDLATMQVVCSALPWGVCVWSPDSRLLAIQQVEGIDVFEVQGARC